MKIASFIKGQRKSITRDPIAILLCFIPFIILIMIKKILPIFIPLDLLLKYKDFTYMIIYLMTPSLLGMMLGLLLIDEKDQDVLSYITVTTFGLSKYIFFKTALGMLISLVINSILAFNLEESFTLNLFLTIILSTTLVPYFSYLIFKLSKNKVEALTKGKLFNFIMFAGVIPYFIDNRIIWLLSIFPTFWVEKLYISNNSPFISMIYLICGSMVAFLTIGITNFLVKSR